MAAQKKNQINLLPQKDLAATTGGRVLLWVLSSFRVTVIVTEIIVIAAVLSRIYLDTRNSNLTDEIKKNQAVIASSLDFEKEFKNTQDKLSIFTELSEGESRPSNLTDIITRSLPPDLLLSKISFDETKVNLEGFSPNERSIQQLIVNLSENDNFNQVSLMEIRSSENDPGLLEFKLRANHKTVAEEI